MTDLDRKQQAARARSFAGTIRQAMRDYWKARSMIAVAYQERHWETLGYESWDDYCAGEFGPERLGLPAEHRDATLELFRAAGMSVRAISSATGVPRSTVADQVSGSGHLADAATQVKGVDGKTYSPKSSGPTGAADHTPPADPDETPARRDLAPHWSPEPEVTRDGGPDQPEGVALEAEGTPGDAPSTEPPAGPVVTTSAAHVEESAAGSPEGVRPSDRPGLEEFVNNDPDVQAASYMAAFGKELSRAGAFLGFDAERVAALASRTTWDAIEAHHQVVEHWFEKASRARKGLRVIKGGAA